MCKQLFKSMDNQQLGALVKAELVKIDVLSVDFESRSHNTEYALINFKHNGYADHFVEIVDDKSFSFCAGSMIYAFLGNNNLEKFIKYQASVCRAQNFIEDNGLPSGFLTRSDVADQCEEQEYLLDKTTADFKPWDLYSMQGELIQSYASLAAIDTKLRNERNDCYDD